MILVERPPNFELILKAFPNADKPGVIFAYGDHIYNPSGRPIPPALLAHEAVHCDRQMNVSHGPLDWWAQYLTDPEFRYREELAAHVAEFQVQAPGIDRNSRAKLLMSTAARLCAPLYNYTPPRSLNVAMRDIKWELDR
jgi:hypothetical protein